MSEIRKIPGRFRRFSPAEGLDPADSGPHDADDGVCASNAPAGSVRPPTRPERAPNPPRIRSLPPFQPLDPAVNRQGPQEMNSKGSPARKSPGSPADEFRWVPGSKIRKGPQQENPKGSPSVISKGSLHLARKRFHRHGNKSGDGRVNHPAIRVNAGAAPAPLTLTDMVNDLSPGPDRVSSVNDLAPGTLGAGRPLVTFQTSIVAKNAPCRVSLAAEPRFWGLS